MNVRKKNVNRNKKKEEESYKWLILEEKKNKK